MTKSKKVLITTEVLFAFVDRQHPKHGEVDAYFRVFAQEQYRVFVSSFTIILTYNHLKKHISYSIAKDFLRTIYTGNIEIIYPDENTTKAAMKLVLNSTNIDLPLEQALENVIADKHQISQIASFEFQNFYFGIQPFSLPY